HRPGLLASRLAAALGRALVNQGDRFGKRDLILVLVARDGRVDAAGGDIGAIAPILDRDRAKARGIGERPAGIWAEAATARALCDLLRNQRHRAVEADSEDLIAGLEAGIGLVVLDEGTKAADAGGDRLARFGVLADLARQRQQLERVVEIDVAG